MQALLEKYLPNVIQIPNEFVQATIDTLYMSFFTSIVSGVLGIFFGVILVVTRQGGILENLFIFNVLDKVFNSIYHFIIAISRGNSLDCGNIHWRNCRISTIDCRSRTIFCSSSGDCFIRS
jgi:ABC-type amino acid transport system permease subunit